MNIVDRYWKELHELRVHVNYLEIYMEKSESKNRYINGFLAITSSGSIGGWVVWKEYGFIWGGIIAASQVINAIKQHFPYRTRLKAIGNVLPEFENLLTSYEKKWFDIEKGKLTEREINDLQYDIRRKKDLYLQKHLGTIILPEKKKYFKKAIELANIKTKNYYG